MQDVLKHALDGMDLRRPEEWVGRVAWQPFRDGVEIHRLYGNGSAGPSAVLLKFQPGGKIPRHLHEGFEHILVLSGSQVDDFGEVKTGELRIHLPGSAHSVSSAAGCLVLAIYERPGAFS